MDRGQLISQVWNWLPTFRAVAETEHLPTAAERLHLSVPALSRTVRQLEESLGHPLFLREGRRLVLNEHGAALLGGVRDAMRMVDNAFSVIDGEVYHGDLRWSSVWALKYFAIETLGSLRKEHPHLLPQLYELNRQELGEQLRRGQLDVAFVTDNIEDESLESLRLGTLTHSVYCGRGHSLYGVENGLSWEDLESCEFATPLPELGQRPRDGWPAERKRKSAMAFDSLNGTFQACWAGELLSVLPNELVQSRFVDHLWKVETPLESHLPCYAIYRRPMGRPTAAHYFAQLMRARVKKLQS